MNAAIWWRVSTRAQLEGSPETQIKEARQLLEAEGYTVQDEYIIGAEWHSLDTLQCPQLQTLLTWVNRGEVRAVGMINSDRLSGEMAQKLAILDMAEKSGVRLLAAENPIESGPDGQLIETVRTYAKYQQVIRAQLGAKKGLRDRVLELGLPANMEPPYGYDFILGANDQGKAVAKLVPDENWHIVKDIWELALSGHAMRGIVNILYQRGIPSPRGREAWRPKAIFRILHNPAYAGRYAAMRSTYEKYDRSHHNNGKNTYNQAKATIKPIDDWVFLSDVEVERPVTTWADFLAMQERLTVNQTMSKRNGKFPYLLRGMIRCEVHNRTYRGKRQVRPSGESVNFLYCCPIANSREFPYTRCPVASMSGTPLEQAVWEHVVELMTDPEKVIGGWERQNKAREESEDVLRQALDAVTKRMQKADSQEMELVTLRVRGDFGDDIYQRQLALIKAERTWCKDEKDRLERQIQGMRQHLLTIEQVKTLCSQFQDKLENATPENQRWLLERLETSLTVAPDGRIRLSFALPDFSDYVSSSRVSDQGTSATSS